MVYLVTGASGQQGGVVARELIQRGESVRVFVRDPARAEELKAMGCEVVVGDLLDAESIRAALQGCSGAFLVTTHFEHGPDHETEQGLTFVRVAEEVGLPHLVYTSVVVADSSPHVPFFNSKWKVEQAIHASGLEWTILRPAFFMENFDRDDYRKPVEQGFMVLPMTKEAHLGMVSVGDIGHAAAEALTHPERFKGETLTLSHERPVTEYVKAIADATGRRIFYQQLPDIVAKRLMPVEYVQMFHWLEEADTEHSSDLEQKLGFSLTSFEDYLAQSNWVRSMSKV